MMPKTYLHKEMHYWLIMSSKVARNKPVMSSKILGVEEKKNAKI